MPPPTCAAHTRDDGEDAWVFAPPSVRTLPSASQLDSDFSGLALATPRNGGPRAKVPARPTREELASKRAAAEAAEAARGVAALPLWQDDLPWWDEDANPLVALLMMQAEGLGQHSATAHLSGPPPAGVGGSVQRAGTRSRFDALPASPTPRSARSPRDFGAAARSRSSRQPDRHRQRRPDLWHSWLRAGTAEHGLPTRPVPPLTAAELLAEIATLLVAKIRSDLELPAPPNARALERREHARAAGIGRRPPHAPGLSAAAAGARAAHPGGAAALAAGGAGADAQAAPPEPAARAEEAHLPLERITLPEFAGEHYHERLQLGSATKRFIAFRLLPALDAYADEGCAVWRRVRAFRELLLTSSLARCDMYLVALTHTLEPMAEGTIGALLARGRALLTLGCARDAARRLSGETSLAEHMALKAASLPALLDALDEASISVRRLRKDRAAQEKASRRHGGTRGGLGASIGETPTHAWAGVPPGSRGAGEWRALTEMAPDERLVDLDETLVRAPTCPRASCPAPVRWPESASATCWPLRRHRAARSGTTHVGMQWRVLTLMRDGGPPAPIIAMLRRCACGVCARHTMTQACILRARDAEMEAKRGGGPEANGGNSGVNGDRRGADADVDEY